MFIGELQCDNLPRFPNIRFYTHSYTNISCHFDLVASKHASLNIDIPLRSSRKGCWGQL